MKKIAMTLRASVFLAALPLTLTISFETPHAQHLPNFSNPPPFFDYTNRSSPCDVIKRSSKARSLRNGARDQCTSKYESSESYKASDRTEYKFKPQ
jgi:hypothetical protein